jgi:hypothetical protein
MADNIDIPSSNDPHSVFFDNNNNNNNQTTLLKQNENPENDTVDQIINEQQKQINLEKQNLNLIMKRLVRATKNPLTRPHGDDDDNNPDIQSSPSLEEEERIKQFKDSMQISVRQIIRKLMTKGRTEGKKLNPKLLSKAKSRVMSHTTAPVPIPELEELLFKYYSELNS